MYMNLNPAGRKH